MAATSSVPFDQSAFETGIRTAMQLAQPNEDADKPTFYFLGTPISSAPADGRGIPFDPNASVDNNVSDPVTDVLCAMEFAAGIDQNTRLGRLDESQLTITFLDDEYQRIKGADHMTVGGMRYDFDSYDGPYALSTSSVWVTYWTARGGRVSSS